MSTKHSFFFLADIDSSRQFLNQIWKINLEKIQLYKINIKKFLKSSILIADLIFFLYIVTKLQIQSLKNKHKLHAIFRHNIFCGCPRGIG